MDLQRLKELARIDEAKSPKAMDQVVLVTDPVPGSEMNDILTKQTLNNFILLVQGAGKAILKENPALYHPRDLQAAIKDAAERMAKVKGKR